ncbi:MAG: hypothetical protein RLZZ313_236, partial [Verrucomicrobiota bacterium]
MALERLVELTVALGLKGCVHEVPDTPPQSCSSHY